VGTRAGLDVLENRKSLTLEEIRTPDCPNLNLATTPTTLSQILVRYGYKDITKSTSLRIRFTILPESPTKAE
jgi:hypothetical protein